MSRSGTLSFSGLSKGLELNNSKLEVLTLDCDDVILDDTGQPIKRKDRIIYLGSLLCADGQAHAEVSRRLGAATAAFNELHRVWNHGNICRTKKIAIFRFCVVSNLLYGLHTLWLKESELKRLDGMYCKGLRKILKIPAAYFSRISNETVLQQAGQPRARALLLEQQLLLYGEIVRLPDESILRRSILISGSMRPAHFNFHRRGRPRHNWHDQVFAHVSNMNCGDSIWNELVWKRRVRDYINARHLRSGSDRSSEAVLPILDAQFSA